MSGWSNSTYRVELVVSGRIAATFPLPAAARDFRAAIAAKSLVNEPAETLGAAPPELLLLLAAGADVALLLLLLAELELELEFELPQAATPMLAVTVSAAMTALPFSKRTLTSSSYLSNNAGRRAGHARTAQRLSQ
jgi:hypothetical protein